MKFLTTPLKVSALSVLSAAVMVPAVSAYEAGDMIIRAGATHVAPNASSSDVTLNGQSTNSTVDVGSDTQLGLTFNYMFTDKWSLEVLAATPFSHDVKAEGDLAGLGNIAEVTHLPPTVSGVYYFSSDKFFKPYVGLGVNYTTFFDEEASSSLTDALGNAEVNLDDSWGWAAQLGADFELNDSWHLNASVRYIDIRTKAKIDLTDLDSVIETKVDVDPWVYTVAVGFKF